jgi:hypothetical protein
MRQQLTAVAAAAALAIAIAAPVAAWDAVSVAITSDSGGATISMTGGIIVPTLLVTPALDARPAGDLGPKFTAVYTMAPSSRALATQELYPYAQGGPVSFIATSGAIADHPYAPGWRQADASVFQAMVDAGLPASAAANPPATTPTGSLGGAYVPVIFGLLALVAVAVASLPLRLRVERRRAA